MRLSPIERASMPVASWMIPLSGHQFDLENLPHWLAGEQEHIAQRNDEFVLVQNMADPVDQYRPVALEPKLRRE